MPIAVTYGPNLGLLSIECLTGLGGAIDTTAGGALDTYAQPGGTFTYRAPGGVDLYLQP